MSKYAVVKIGSSQEKVSVGDVLTVPANFKIESKTPILMSARKGSLITDEKKLSKYSVNFELLDEKKSKKLNIFTYKNKSGIRRKLGYREDIKIVKVKSISTGKVEEEEKMTKTARRVLFLLSRSLPAFWHDQCC